MSSEMPIKSEPLLKKTPRRIPDVTILYQKFVAYAVNRQQMPRIVRWIAKFFPQLHDHLVQGAGGAKIIVAPNLVQQLIARKDFPGMLLEKLQQPQLFRREFFGGAAAPQFEPFWIDGAIADLEH